jgi:hypothetical protein
VSINDFCPLNVIKPPAPHGTNKQTNRCRSSDHRQRKENQRSMTDASIPIECTIDATYNPGWMLEEKIFLAHFFL